MSTIAERQKIALAQSLLTVNQFALLTQYQPKSIYRLIAQGRLRVVRIGRRTIRIPRSEARPIRDQHPNADQTLVL